MKFTPYISAFVLSSAVLMLTQAAHAGPAEDGKAAYVVNGCWQCHGFVGQGGVAGPKLAPDPKPAEFYAVFVRHTNGPMPPYGQAILSAKDLADIHAYLKTIPKGPEVKNIPLLNALP